MSAGRDKVAKKYTFVECWMISNEFIEFPNGQEICPYLTTRYCIRM
jgi:hypothetical protein